MWRTGVCDDSTVLIVLSIATVKGEGYERDTLGYMINAFHPNPNFNPYYLTLYYLTLTLTLTLTLNLIPKA